MRNSPTVSQLFVAPLRNKPLKRRRFRHEKRLPESSGSPTGGEYEIPQQLSSNPAIAIIPRVMGSVTHALSKFSTPDSTKIRFKQICAGDRSQATQKQIGAKRRAFGTAASLSSCCSMRVFLFKTMDRYDDFIPSKPLFFKKSLFKAMSMRYPEDNVIGPQTHHGTRSSPIFPDINNGFGPDSPRRPNHQRKGFI